LQLGRAGCTRVHAHLGEVAHDLLDEERVPLGLPVQGSREHPRRCLPRSRPDELGRLPLAQSRDVDMSQQALALQIRERVAQHLAGRLRPVCDQDQQVGRLGGPREVT
jgi:hypothetical protein